MIDRLLSMLDDLVSGSQGAAPREDMTIQLAAAALMIEVARADQTKQDVELNRIESVLSEQFHLESEKLHELIAAASDRVEQAHDLFQFTQLINENFSYEEKRRLLYAMWQVAFADSRIEALEEHVIRRVSDLLHLQQKDFIQLKLQARDRQLSRPTDQ